jgi:hypothetical protein
MAYALNPAAFRLRNLDGQKVGTELQKIADQPSGLRPESVVEAARPPQNPMHSAFTWDDTTAATKFRLQEAEYLIRSVILVPDDVTPEDIHAVIEDCPRAFHNVRPNISDEPDPGVPNTRRGEYMSHDDVMRDPYLRAQLIKQAMSNLAAWGRKYRHLKEFKRIVKAIDDTAEQLNCYEVT